MEVLYILSRRSYFSIPGSSMSVHFAQGVQNSPCHRGNVQRILVRGRQERESEISTTRPVFQQQSQIFSAEVLILGQSILQLPLEVLIKPLPSKCRQFKLAKKNLSSKKSQVFLIENLQCVNYYCFYKSVEDRLTSFFLPLAGIEVRST